MEQNYTSGGWERLRRIVLSQNNSINPTSPVPSNISIIQVQSTSVLESNNGSNDSSPKGKESEIEKIPMTSIESSYFNGLYLVLIIPACLLASSILTLIPYHDIIRYPQYWYEYAIQVSFGFWMFKAIHLLVDAALILNYSEIRSAKRIAMMAFESIAMSVVSICLVHVIWSVCLGFNPPMPKTGLVILPLVYIYTLGRLWFAFPTELRHDKKFRKRLKWYYTYLVVAFIQGFQFVLMNMLFQNIPPNLQWVMAFVLQVFREVNKKVLGELVTRASGTDDQHTALCLIKIGNSLTFGFYLVIQLVNNLTELTIWFILGVDFISSLFFYVSLKKNHQKLTNLVPTCPTDVRINGNENKMLTEFILGKSTELIIPVIYVLTFLMAYHGPNNEIIGGVGCDYWHFQKIEDLSMFVCIELTLFALIATNIAVSFILVWVICRKNVYQIYCSVMKKFWYIILIKTVCQVTLVSLNMFMTKCTDFILSLIHI